MGWMNDTLEYLKLDPIVRKDHHEKMTFSMMYAFSENYILPLSHDEVVHGKRSMLDKCFGTYEQKFDALRSYYTFMIGHPGKKLSFMGNEFGPFMEWRYYEQLEWGLLDHPKHAMLREYVKALNTLYRKEKALWELDDRYDGFEWVNAEDKWRNVFSFVRKSKDPEDFLLFVINMCPVTREKLSVGIPRFTEYKEILSSDRVEFGGGGLTNDRMLKPRPSGADGKRFSIELDLAPYGAVVLKPVFRESVSNIK
jgi:1,4-alpha-glucan branching enzyme